MTLITNKDKIKQRKQQFLHLLAGYNLMDDCFMNKFFGTNPVYIQFVLRIILDNPKLEIVDVRTQVQMGPLEGRNIRVDILATAADATLFDVEIQRSLSGSLSRRAKLYQSILTASLLEKGKAEKDLPDVWVIFISERDPHKESLPLYQFENQEVHSQYSHQDGGHIVYINGDCREDTPLGWLMHDFFCTSADKMHYDVLGKHMRYLKETKEGVELMSDNMDKVFYLGKEEGREEGAEGNKINNVKNLLTSTNLTPETIASCICLPLDQVLQIQKELQN